MVDLPKLRRCVRFGQDSSSSVTGVGTGQAGGNLRGVACALLLSVAWAGTAIAGDLDRYRYVLEESKDDKVCRHMEKVYNGYFAFPWKRPMLDREGTYGPNSRYAFPKLPGVTHDDRMTFDMTYSRLPSTPEFDAIEWKEGRYRFVVRRDDHRDRPMLVAEFDIDNNGRADIVIKPQFILGFYPSRRSWPGGEDAFFVFDKREIDLSQPLTFEMFYEGQSGRKKPARIGFAPGAPYRLIRPFVLDGLTYLSAYQQDWPDDDDIAKVREHVDVLRYRGGAENLGKGGWSPLQIDRVCRFRMTTVKPQ